MRMERRIKWMPTHSQVPAASQGVPVLPAEQGHPCDTCRDGTGRDSGGGEGAGTGAHTGSPCTPGAVVLSGAVRRLAAALLQPLSPTADTRALVVPGRVRPARVRGELRAPGGFWFPRKVSSVSTPVRPVCAQGPGGCLVGLGTREPY